MGDLNEARDKTRITFAEIKFMRIKAECTWIGYETNEDMK